MVSGENIHTTLLNHTLGNEHIAHLRIAENILLRFNGQDRDQHLDRRHPYHRTIMKKHSYLTSPAYKKWVLARDKALEQIHIRAQLEATDEMRKILSEVLNLSRSHYHDLKTSYNQHAIDQFESRIKDIMRTGTAFLVRIYDNVRTKSFLLSKTSEAEILAQLNSAKSVQNMITKHELVNRSSFDSFVGGPVYQRINLYMDRLARKIISQAQASAIVATDVQSYLFDILRTFPKRNVYKRPPRVLKPKLMTEAEKPPKFDAAIDMIDDSEWQGMVADYKDDYIPKWRAPEYIVDIPVTDPTMTATGEEVWYAWEFERDLTNEFVKSVRDGQVAAATAIGITDFVWIAVIDSATDACCRWRDGLLVSEIEKQLSQHVDDDDECNLDADGLTPPIHFNCRCTLAPATENIPDKPDADTKDFEEWLES